MATSMSQGTGSWRDFANFPELVAEASLRKYKELPKRGKPKRDEEWTPLATVLCSEGMNVEVVALGTGSKCIGQSKMNKEGWIVNDSHAEIVARRAFLRYLVYQLKLAVQSESSIFVPVSTNDCDGRSNELPNMYILKPGVAFHFFTSQMPCGDASIFALSCNEGSNKGNVRKRQQAASTCERIASKRNKISPDSDQDTEFVHKSVATSIVLTTVQTESVCACEHPHLRDLVACKSHADSHSSTEFKPCRDGELDVHRTGAKCVSGGLQDPKLPGVRYHTVGTLRTKPGRGDPTLSMSCSDKMMRWNVLGCQGALLAHFIAHSVYFESFTFSGPLLNSRSIYRALIGRIKSTATSTKECHIHCPEIFCLSSDTLSATSISGLMEVFNEVTYSEIKKLAPAAICWYVGHDSEAIVQGMRQGANTRRDPCRKTSVSICKHRVFEDFQDLVSCVSPAKLPSTLRFSSLNTYHSFKMASLNYQQAKKEFLDFCPTWLSNDPAYEQFEK